MSEEKWERREKKNKVMREEREKRKENKKKLLPFLSVRFHFWDYTVHSCKIFWHL